MSKSVGGFIQLIIPKEQMTWDEYKKKYGIDLDEIFMISPDNNVYFKPGINKPVLISGYENINGTPYNLLPGCGFMTYGNTVEASNYKTLNIIYGSYESSVYFGIGLRNDRSISFIEG